MARISFISLVIYAEHVEVSDFLLLLEFSR